MLLEFRLLGGFSAFRNGRQIRLPSHTDQALLAYLLLHPQDLHSRESLFTLFWPDNDENSARRSLNQTARRIQKATSEQGQALLLAGEHYLQINPDQPYWLDAAVLQEPAPPADAALTDLEGPVMVYRGELLPGFFEPWVVAERDRLHKLFEAKIQRLLDRQAVSERWQELRQTAGQWIEIDPVQEPAYRALMLAEHGLGSLDGVQAAFERCAELLQQEQGTRPSAQTRALLEQLQHNRSTRLAIPATGALAAPARQREALAGPYPGLPGFDQSSASLLYGRENLLNRLINRFCQPGLEGRLVILVGASGSGKSSLLRGGLLPAIQFARPQHSGCQLPAGSAHWPTALVVPGRQPLQSLAAALVAEPEAQTALAGELEQDPQRLHRYAHDLLEKMEGQPDCLLLVVDSLEALYIDGAADHERDLFLANLIQAAEGGCVRIAAALRSDFYAQFLEGAPFGQVLPACQLNMEAMTPAELRQAIETPALLQGWELEDGLVERILADLEALPERANRLPDLAQALRAAWLQREERTLTLAGYRRSGGVKAVLPQTANQVLREMSPEQQKIARKIFLATAGPERGREETRLPLDIARPVDPAALDLDGDRPAGEEVLQRLVDARLISLPGGQIQLSHPALIRAWPALRRWIQEEQRNQQLHAELSTAAERWEAEQRSPAQVWQGARLAQALELAARGGPLTHAEKEFLSAAQYAADREAGNREDQRRRELEAVRQQAETQGRQAAEQAQRSRRLSWLAAALAVLLLVAAGAAVTGFVQRSQAQSQRQAAVSHELAAQALNSLSVDPERGILLALQALTSQDTPQAEEALHQTVQGFRLEKTFQTAKKNAASSFFSADGLFLLTSSTDGQGGWLTEMWDTTTAGRVLTMDGKVLSKSWGGYRGIPSLLNGEGDSAIIGILNVRSGEPLRILTPSLPFSVKDILKTDLTSNRRQIAMNLNDGTTRVYDLGSGQSLLTLGQPGQTPAQGVAFSPDGSLILTTVNGVTAIWRVDTGEQVTILPTGLQSGGAVAFSSTGLYVAAGVNTVVKIHETFGSQILQLAAASPVSALAFSPDDSQIAAGGEDGSITLWNSMNGTPLLTLVGHSGPVTGISFSPNGQRLATTGLDGTARIWDISPTGGREQMAWSSSSPNKAYSSVAFSADGKKLAASGGDQAGQIWNIDNGVSQLTLPGSSRSLGSAAFSSDGSLLALTSSENSIHILNASAGNEIRTLQKRNEWIIAMAFSPDGSRLASINEDWSVTVWDAPSGKELWTVPESGETLNRDQKLGIAFSPDGKLLAASSRNQARVWDAASGSDVQVLPDQDAPVTALAFSPDGKSLAIGLGTGGKASVWNIQSGERLAQMDAHNGAVQGLVFSRDGKRLYSGSTDGSLRAWDSSSGQALMVLARRPAAVTGIALSPDGLQLAASSQDGLVEVYQLDIQALAALARQRVTRGLTAEECQQFLHQDACPLH